MSAPYDALVGSRLEQRAKALLFRRYADGGAKSYLVYALPGNAEAHVELERQTGCRFGELPPFGSIFGCALALDGRLLTVAELYFNAGRLDRSVVLTPDTLVALEAPTMVE